MRLESNKTARDGICFAPYTRRERNTLSVTGRCRGRAARNALARRAGFKIRDLNS
jgi:hypothetical protein